MKAEAGEKMVRDMVASTALAMEKDKNLKRSVVRWEPQAKTASVR